MPFFDESTNPEVPLPLGEAPPPAALPELEGVIGNAVARLRDGKSGFILVHETSQDGKMNTTHAVFVKRFGDDIVATGWVGRDWSAPGTVSYGASLTWEFD